MAITLSEVVMNGKELSSTEQVAELQNFINEAADERIIRTRKGSAEIYLQEEQINITVGGSNGVIINENGSTFDGKVHLAQDPNNIRIGGFWCFNNELLTCLPSTIYTPIPTLVYDEPGAVAEVQAYTSYVSGLV
jgi:hypothetical protein